MSLELCILASGSSGNCTVVRMPGGVMLIDAGIGPRLAAQRLNGTGVRVADVTGVLLTHLDSDHFSPAWAQTLIRNNAMVYCHQACVAKLLGITGHPDFAALVRPFGHVAFTTLPGLTVTPIGLAHDCQGSHGFVLEGFGRRLGYATDLGHVPEGLIEQFHDLDVLALESNYDPAMQEQTAAVRTS